MKDTITLKSGRTIKSISIGQNVFLVGTGNYKNYPPRYGAIEKIGKKYFYINVGSNWGLEKFDIEDGSAVNDYNYGYLIFENEEAYNKYKLAESSFHDIYMYFHDNSFYRSKLSFETIEAIHKLIYSEE